MIRKLFEIPFVLALSLPGMIVGYLLCWFIGGLYTGRAIFERIHK